MLTTHSSSIIETVNVDSPYDGLSEFIHKTPPEVDALIKRVGKSIVHLDDTTKRHPETISESPEAPCNLPSRKFRKSHSEGNLYTGSNPKYFFDSEIIDYPLLSKLETEELLKTVRIGKFATPKLVINSICLVNGFSALYPNESELTDNVKDGTQAREKLIKSNIRLLFSIARSYA